MPTDQVNKENPIMQYFAYALLPAPLKNVSMVIAHTDSYLMSNCRMDQRSPRRYERCLKRRTALSVLPLVRQIL